MKTQLEKLLPWDEVERDDEIIQYQETPLGVVTREPLYKTREHDQHPDNPQEIITVTRYNRFPAPLPAFVVMMAIENAGEKGVDVAIPDIVIWLPGLCGHYDQCGTAIVMNLN